MSRRLLYAALFVAVVAGLLTFVSFNRQASTVARAQTTELLTLALGTPVGGFSSPVGFAHADDRTNRLYVVEQGGRVRIVKSGVVNPSPFLDISGRISTGGERGLLGLAFPPDYERKGYFYVNYTNTAGNTVISRFRRNPSDADQADPSSEQVVLTVAQPFPNHNGGQLAFGPVDRMLYVGMGDGGDGGDPGNRAQNPGELLGKILRLDTETGRPFTYTTPSTNPFLTTAGFRPEIWALGMRNPWRFSFDRTAFDLYIADVGQGNWEEVNFQPASSAGGENYGWRIMEGLHCFNPNPCNQAGLTLPILEYSSGAGSGNCSVTGGYVYRGDTYPRMKGLYFYGDFCSGRIWSLRRQGSDWQNNPPLDTSIQISAFGEDEQGNLYVASYGTGQIFPVVDNGPAVPPTVTPTPEVRFGSPVFLFNEAGGVASVPVVRSGDTSVDIYVDYATSDGTASSRSDYTAARGTLHFAPGETQKRFDVLVTNDETDEADENLTLTLSNFVGSRGIIEGIPQRLMTIQDDDAATSHTNPIDRSDFFVRQHYHDFLNREPDAEGLAFWVGGIESCGEDLQCREVKRIDTSAAFFLSIEFQETGFLVYLLHKAAFGNVSGTPVPVRFADFLRDTQEIGRGVIVNQGDWRALLEANKQAFVNAFVSRPAFVNLYATGQTPAQYVNALNTNAGLVLTPAEVSDLVARLADGRETRATVLRRVAEDADIGNAEFNRAFVLMQYFGYLRRDPDASPDTSFEGYNHWLGKLNDFGGDYRRAEMVKAFLSSTEYRQRFRP
ncbi:MAG TPA: PQQ-dependent sugar dehydrogenase [Pyrinomonadaceae bacterium]|nr:PQQ-dependent sugar dehydrogenase [Pyrinomonadaceae bacterium]